jgi:signal transduction histidine kinase
MSRRESRLVQATGVAKTARTIQGMDMLPEGGDDLMPEEFRLRFHELSVSWGELEMQHEELRRRNAELNDEECRIKLQKIEELGVLADGIAHNFNNLLMVVMGHVYCAKMLLSPTDKAHERLTIAEAAAFKTKELTQQFHAFSKERAPLIHSISTSCLFKSYAHLALSDSKSTIACAVPEDLWNIEADDGQIGQALTNILINADQAMPGGGVVTVHFENVVANDQQRLPLKHGRYVKIAISDQGCGIPEKYLFEIFEPYFTTKGKGRGLGLTTAYSILKRHGGRLDVESTPGRGATFTLFIPASPAQVPVSGQETPHERSGAAR